MIIVASVLLAIGVTVVAVFDKSMPGLTGVAGMANQTIYVAANSAFTGLNLGSIVLVVLVAVAIIWLILFAFRSFVASGAAD